MVGIGHLRWLLALEDEYNLITILFYGCTYGVLRSACHFEVSGWK